MTGPLEEVSDLERSGVALEFDLSRLTKEELEKLSSKNGEVLFSIPSSWKKVKVPWISSGMIPLNSADASQMEMLFLKEEPIALKGFIPLLTVFPINEHALPFKESSLVLGREATPYLNLPLFIEGTSQTFADLLGPHLAIVIEAGHQAIQGDQNNLAWNLVVLSSENLENTYVRSLLAKGIGDEWGKTDVEERLREHFRNYLSSLCLTTESGKLLTLKIRSTPEGIEIKDVP